MRINSAAEESQKPKLHNFLNTFLSQRAKSEMDENGIKNCVSVLRKHQFQPIKRLGKGAFGIVFLVEKITTKEYFSIKCTSKMLFNKKPQLKKYIKQQIGIMRNLDHPNIVKLYDAFQDFNWIFMVMEYCNEGNLMKIQSQRPSKVFQIEECLQIIGQLISGLSYMHSCGILHRDIKLQNILRTRKNEISSTKICDFGFSRQVQEKTSTYCGTSFYMAPEIILKQNYDKKVDIWALGVVIFIMLFGCLPFKNINMFLQIKKKCQFGFDLSKSIVKTNTSLKTENMETLSVLFKSIFEINPIKRISLEGIVCELFKRDPRQIVFKKNQSLETTDTQRDESLVQLEQVQFIQWVLKEVQRQKFLNFAEFLKLKYYLDKVCLSILVCERDISTLSEKQMHCIQCLRESQKLDFRYLYEDFQKGKQQNIQNEGQRVSVKNNKFTIIFKEYKQEYRVAVGHAFSKAHQKIKNPSNQSRIKLKLFCCHLINRVFEKEHRNGIFQHHFRWKLKNSEDCSFNMQSFKRWLQEEEQQKISKTIELINAKFFKKQKSI